MSVKVEFFGIPRLRAGVDSVHVEADNVGQLIDELSRRFPALAVTCFEHGSIRHGYLANVNGTTFTRDAATPLRPNDCVLILSADVGG